MYQYLLSYSKKTFIVYAVKFKKCGLLILQQARIQRLKVVSQTDYVPGFPLAAAWISRSNSVMICVELPTLTHWLGAYHAKSAEDCISVEKLNTLNTDLQSILQNINKFSAGHTRPILTNTKSSRSHKFCPEFCGIF